MNCREARCCMSPYLDSELDPTTTFAISEHLRHCADCRGRFEAERRVDLRMAGALGGETVPDELWARVVGPVRRSRPVRRPLFALLAAAAVVALVVLAGQLHRPAAPEAHWVVREFLAETNGGQPFASAEAVTVPAGMRLPLEPFGDLVMGLAGEAALQHVVQLVRMETVRDADGVETVEVRLNCCGEPVVVRVARRDRPGRLREFLEADAVRIAALPAADRVAVAEREVGAYLVVAVSRHPTDELLASMSVQ